MKTLAPVLFCLIAACSTQPPSPTVQAGTWTGGLIPMNHLDMVLPLSYEVKQTNQSLAITIINEDTRTVTHDVSVTDDTLHFVFNEPEANIILTCALALQPDASYAGRCTDPEGKWANFTMIPPR